jgi:EAL domain-containing protein (putative c-di-GMP-specific phosphodiesterase class I)
MFEEEDSGGGGGSVSIGSNEPRLVVVDDEPDIGAFVCEVATTLGYEAVATDHPVRFQELYHDDFQVVVLDLMMPQVDGVELIRFLSDQKCRAGIVLISGFDRQVLNATRDLAEEHGLRVIGCLRKPIEYGLLEKVLRLSPREKGDAARKQAEELTLPEIERAIANRELVVHFQPKVRLTDGALDSLEALVRWNHPTRGLLPPALFVPVAEKAGLIDEVTVLVLEQVLDQTGIWLAEGLDVRVAVNFSARSLTDLSIPERMVQLIGEHGLDPSRVIIEVTETAVMEQLVNSLDVLTRLRLKGVDLSIDDYGTGFSSLQQLKRIPCTEMKIDRSFIMNVCEDGESRTIVESTIDMGHRLGIKVVAEGVETQEHWDLLRSLRCDVAQGYFIARPMPGSELSPWLARRRGS